MFGLPDPTADVITHDPMKWWSSARVFHSRHGVAASSRP